MEKTYKIDLSLSDLRIIAAALQELPYRVAKPVLENMAAQTEVIDKAAATNVEKVAEEVSQ